jgi:protein-S-isoprenylcysteine O-methyltransferase Ste14
MFGKMIFRSIVGTVFIALLLFVAAGTMDWPQAWVFIVIFIGCSLATGVWLQRTDPGLFAARMASPLSRDQAPCDRAVIVLIFAAFFVWFIVMAFDARRFAWSHVPLWAQVVGAVLVLWTFWGWVTVLRANSFAAVNVRLQHERSQTVASSGPYAIVRHPMYSYTFVFIVGIALLLGSWWGLAGLIVLVPLFALRALGEETMLMGGLAGYRDYAARVRFRLVPGVW